MNVVKVIGTPLYQWESGRKVQISPHGRLHVVAVHFSHVGDARALVVDPIEENGMITANVPNVLLQSDSNIVVYVVDVSEDRVETLRECVLGVHKRAKPDDYVYTETEVRTYTALEKRIDGLTAADVGAQPKGNYALKSEIPAPVSIYTGTLAVNNVYTAELAGEVAFTLPIVTDLTHECRIRMLASIAAGTTINWGTDVYYGAAVPFVNEGFYEIIWDYNCLIGAWVVGATRIGRVVSA